jgi:small subunit ribosomal protein S16
MAVRIRLQRRGAHKKPFYHVVVADSRAPRDGKFIEKIGVYNPLKSPEEISIRTEVYAEWIRKGAQPSDAVAELVRKVQKAAPPQGEPVS